MKMNYQLDLKYEKWNWLRTHDLPAAHVNPHWKLPCAYKLFWNERTALWNCTFTNETDPGLPANFLPSIIDYRKTLT